MDPCPFVRLTIESLSLKLLHSPTKPLPLSGVHPSTTPCFCKIRIQSFPSRIALLPLSSSSSLSSQSQSQSTTFHLDSTALLRLSAKPLTLSISVYNGPMGRNCGVPTANLLGRVVLPIQLPTSLSSSNTFHNGWFKLCGNREPDPKPSHMLHLLVRSEPDPRFVFHFGGEPECSPVIFQIQENIKQPVFSCKFTADRNYRSQLVHFSLLFANFCFLLLLSKFVIMPTHNSFLNALLTSIKWRKPNCK